MTDVQKKNQDAEVAAENKHSSKGERWFNILTYGGISGLAVFIASIFAGYSAQYGKGKQLFSKLTESLTGLGLKKETAEKSILMNTALSIPGTLAVIPIKMLEDRKLKIVSKIDCVLGEETDRKKIEEEPKQTWASMLKGRLVAWGAIFAAFKVAASVAGVNAEGESRFDSFEKKFSKYVVCKPLGKPTHINGEPTRLFNYGKVASLDAFATVAATILLFFGSKFFAKSVHRTKEKSAEVQKDAASVQSAEPLDKPVSFASSLVSPQLSHADAIAAQRESSAAVPLQVGA